MGPEVMAIAADPLDNGREIRIGQENAGKEERCRGFFIGQCVQNNVCAFGKTMAREHQGDLPAGLGAPNNASIPQFTLF